MVFMSSDDDLKTVGEVSQLLGLSVRTLHYWEERGLVAPTARSWSEYRLYSLKDIQTLEQIVIYRATGMALDEIAEVLSAGDNKIVHLQRQKKLLMEKQNELGRMVQALDCLLEDAMGSNKLSVDDVAKILGNANFPVYQAEAEEQWGETDDWKISQQRASRMSVADWLEVKERTEAVEAELVRAMSAGIEPGSEEANRLAESHRELVSQFFQVNHAKHVLIARGYVGDPRFVEYYDARATGLAKWLKQIIDANAIVNGIDPTNAVWE